MRRSSIHLVCSSGGVKCFSYIGAIKCLEEHGVQIKSVAASSMGSFIGIMVCSGMSAEEMQRKVVNIKISEYIRNRYWIKRAALLKYPFAMYHTPDFKKILVDVVGEDHTLEKLTIPYATMALDLRLRQLLVYSSLTHPKMLSSDILKIATAIPPMYEPYAIDNRLLVDAGVATESPAWLSANLSIDEPIIILKSSRPVEEKYTKSLSAFITNMVTSAAAGNDNFSLSQINNAISIEINCGDQTAEDFKITKNKIENLILQGYDSMQKQMNEFNGDFKNRIKVTKIADEHSSANPTELAAFNSTQLASKFIKQTSRKRDQVFISYSHKDKFWYDKILKFLRPLEEFSGINIWSDEEIMPGNRWREAIQEALAVSKVALCIVTQNFFDSEFITSEELNYFIQASEKEKVPIFWISASRSIYNTTPLRDIQCAHDPEIPLDNQTETEQNDIIVDICYKLIAAMKG